ncbi:MAG: PIN-like domain-containing protein [Bacteroidetes bacterium]|nr:PIN-like domain-containing protein [Bacteroidota bacterium]
MDTLFRTHKEISEEDFKFLWEKGLFVFDANVLLDLYRLPETARKDLLNILSDKKIKNRVWLPFQVSLEFIYNKIEAIGDQKNKYNAVKEIINDAISQTDAIHSELQKKLSDLQLKKRHSTINPDPYINEELFKPSINILNNFLEELVELDKKQPDVNDKDLIQQQIFKLFENKIGAHYSKENLDTIYKEGELRYKENIPPGYKDKSKEGYYMYEDKKFIRKFGDLVVWKEIIKKSNDDKVEYLILVTGDSKEDWWQEKRGKKIGPRYELLNEVYFEAKSVKLFHMYDTSNFMQYSKKYLNINVKEQSIVETKDLLEFSKSLSLLDTMSNGILPIRQILNKEIASFPTLKLRYSTTIPQNQYLLVPQQDMHLILTEIFSNVAQHSSDKIISSRSFRAGEYLVLRFRNNITPESYEKIDARGMGIRFIRDVMEQYGLVEVTKTTQTFKIALYFDKKYTMPNKIIAASRA